MMEYEKKTISTEDENGDRLRRALVDLRNAELEIMAVWATLGSHVKSLDTEDTEYIYYSDACDETKELVLICRELIDDVAAELADIVRHGKK